VRPGFASDAKALRGRTVKVTAGQDPEDLVFHLLMTGVISGKIVDTDGDPLRGVGVTATAIPAEKTRRTGGAMHDGATNDLGEYRIADLPPGKYIVQASPPQNEGPLPNPNEKAATKERLVYITTYFPGTLDERQAAAINLHPLPEADEESPAFGMPQTAMAKVNEDGSFEIKDGPGIDCQLEIAANSDKFRDFCTKSVLLGGREVADTGFTVGPGTKLDVVVSAKGAAIEGR
jgi:carboxypeptidase family protein